MADLFVMIGIPGAGKSSFIEQNLKQKYPNLEVISTDAIREELCGDASDNSRDKEVFPLSQERMRNALSKGQPVVYDATNVSKKDRRRLFSSLGRLDKSTQKHAIVVLAEPEVAIANQEKRTRFVPDYAIYRMMARFQMPTKSEGFSDVVLYHPYEYDDLLSSLREKIKGFDQTGKYHVENLREHIDMAVKAGKNLGASDAVEEALRNHDYGKLYTRSYDEDGNAHFYGHENASAYLYLCAKTKGFQISKNDLYVTWLIEHHDMLLHSSIDKEKLRLMVGEQRYHDLCVIREADKMGMISKEDVKDMSLTDFLNTFENAEDMLKAKPYCVKVKHDGDLALFKYTQFDSDMSYRCVRESRGSIFTKTEDGTYDIVCRPFDKFFNYGEEYASEIDWGSARVLEKVDGSLCKMFYTDGQWHLATNGTINAFDAGIGENNHSQFSFGDIFERAVGCSVAELGSTLDKSRTYMFELTSPETQIVIPYQDGVYYLSSRDTKTGQEFFDRPVFIDTAKIKYPKQFDLTSLSNVVNVVSQMTQDEEGVVVNDKYGNRIKVKSPEYLAQAHLRINGNISYKKLLEYRKKDMLDDVLAYNETIREKSDKLQSAIETTWDAMDDSWEKVSGMLPCPRKDFAIAAKKLPYSFYLFEKVDNEKRTAEESFTKLSLKGQIASIEKANPGFFHEHVRRLPPVAESEDSMSLDVEK